MDIPKVNFGRFELDYLYHEVRANDKYIVLTPVQFRILYRLLTAPDDEAITRPEILKYVWKNANDYPTMRAIDVHIKRIREQLNEITNLGERLIESSYKGNGYKINRKVLIG